MKIVALLGAAGVIATSASAQSFFGPGGPATVYYGGLLFDVTNQATLDIFLTGKFKSFTNWTGDGVYRVYTKDGTNVGFQSNLSAWTLLGEATANGAGLGNSFTFDVGATRTIPVGATVGVAIFHVGGSGWATGDGAIGYRFGGNTFSDGNISITTGTAKGYGTPADPFSSPLTFTPRTWAGEVQYEVVPEPITLAGLAVAALAVANKRRRNRS